MDFDDILKYVDEFGPFQQRVYFLLCLFCISHGTRVVVLVFILSVPKHRCSIPGYVNDSYDITSPEHQLELKKSIPANDSCHIYLPSSHSNNTQPTNPNPIKQKCSHWVYDKSEFTNTVASEFNLVCDDAPETTLSSMTFYFGILTSTFALGVVSDKLGRKKCLFLSLTVLLIMGICQAWTNSFIAFTILNFFVGTATPGIFPSAFVIGVELVGPSKRTIAAMIVQVFFSLGVCLLGVMAYFIRDWHYLLMSITCPLGIFYLMWCFIPESPRWQIQKGLYSGARYTVLQAAKVNRKEVPDWILDKVMPLKVNEKTAVAGHLSSGKEEFQIVEEVFKEKGKFVDLFKSRVLLLRTSIIFLNWFIISMTYYTLNFNAGNLGAGSIYLNFFLSGLVELPAHIIIIFTIDRLGRKIIHSCMLIFCGMACLLCVLEIIFAPEGYQWLAIVLAMMSKFGVTGAFSTIYLYSSELFPTVIRHSALGASSSWARLGAMLAPFVAAQGASLNPTLGRSVPLLISGCLSLMAGLLACLLPETLNQKLPETLSDAKNFTKHVVKTVELDD